MKVEVILTASSCAVNRFLVKLPNLLDYREMIRVFSDGGSNRIKLIRNINKEDPPNH